jgi:hypothetical protein
MVMVLKKEGGLISFKNMVVNLVVWFQVNGHGMEDNVYMPITEGPKNK